MKALATLLLLAGAAVGGGYYALSHPQARINLRSVRH